MLNLLNSIGHGKNEAARRYQRRAASGVIRVFSTLSKIHGVRSAANPMKNLPQTAKRVSVAGSLETDTQAETRALAKLHFEWGTSEKRRAACFASMELHQLEAQHLDRAQSFFEKAIDLMMGLGTPA